LFSADNFGGEAARQFETARASGQGEVAEHFELGEVEGEGVRLAETAQDAPLQSQWLRFEELQVQSILEAGVEDCGDKVFEECSFSGGDFSGIAESLPQARIVVALEGRQQIGTDAIAEELRIEVGGIATIRLADGVQVSLHLLASGGEQRADQARRVYGRAGTERAGRRDICGHAGEIETAVNSRETAGSGAAQQAEEHGFGLVVAGVRGGNAVEAMSGGSAQEECITGAASGSFEREVMERGERGYVFGLDDGF
jgi:hypothetical protein